MNLGLSPLTTTVIQIHPHNPPHREFVHHPLPLVEQHNFNNWRLTSPIDGAEFDQWRLT